MYYIQANIGRNYKGTDTAMSLADWNGFVTYVADTLGNGADRATSGQTLRMPWEHIEIHRGTGTYGNVEESAHISLVWEEFDMDYIRERLAGLADEFMQDAIALIVGSELIYSS